MGQPFDPAGRERYVARMKQVGYVEYDVFRPHEDGYCCQSCPAMVFDTKSPSGWWCRLVGFPDKPNGCCDKWYAKPEVQRTQ
jgi:hypothetical protein